MPGDDRDLAPLWDMLKYARRAVLLSQRAHYEAYCDDWALQMAMERALEIVGEAARRVSPEFRSAHPAVPWNLIVGQRNFLAHEYGGIRNERIWETATVHVPALIAYLAPLVPDDARGIDDV